MSPYKALQAQVEARLQGLFGPGNEVNAALYEAMNYSLLSGGKRLRPVLVLAACQACGGELDQALDAACALECVHCYSLIHDDLPAMDDDDLRRGQPTNHKVYGEALAILAGDGLLTEAFGLIARSWLQAGQADIGLELVAILAHGAGAEGMVAGQALDVASEEVQVDGETMKAIHRHKTGALIEAACQMGGAMARAKDADRQALAAYAQALGLAFQIVDDLLDVEGDPQILGKATGSDLKNQKATYPSLYGIPASKAMAQDLKDQALAAIGSLPGDTGALEAIAELTVERIY